LSSVIETPAFSILTSLMDVMTQVHLSFIMHASMT